MELSKMGIIVNQCLVDIPKHFKNVLICESVIMPNHIHLLLSLKPTSFNPIETHHNASLATNQTNIKSINSNQQKNDLKETPYMASLQEHPNQILIGDSQRNLKQTNFNHVETHHDASLTKRYNNYFYHRIAIRSSQTIPLAIKQFKSAVTHQINPKTIFFAWQPRYHDVIIKDEKQFFTIKNYIKNNVINWERDKYFTN